MTQWTGCCKQRLKLQKWYAWYAQRKTQKKREIVCVSERHRQRETEREKERERQNVCRGMLSSSFLGYFEKKHSGEFFSFLFYSFLKSLKSFFVQIWMNLKKINFVYFTTEMAFRFKNVKNTDYQSIYGTSLASDGHSLWWRKPFLYSVNPVEIHTIDVNANSTSIYCSMNSWTRK